MALGRFVALAFLAAPIPGQPAGFGPGVEVKVTQKYLVPLCVNGAHVDDGERRFKLLPGSHLLAFTMRNAAPQNVPGAEPDSGTAVIDFTLEAGHKYEVEVRAPAMTFTARTWKAGEWKPVVRDRTADRIVSSEPDWTDKGCER